MSGYVALLRRSAVLSAFPAYLGVVGLHLALRPRPWVHEWYWSFDSYWFVTVLLGPIVAGLSCWESTRWCGARDYHIATGQLGSAVVRVTVSSTIWPLAGFLTGLVAVAVLVRTNGAHDWPSAGVMLSAAPALSLLVLCSVVGSVTGWVAGRLLAAPLVAVGVFAVLLCGYTVLPGSWLAIGGATSSLLSLAPRTALHLLQALLYLDLAALAIVLAIRHLDRAYRMSLLGIGVLLMSGIGLLAALPRVATMRFVEVKAPVACSGQRPVVCLAPAYADLEPAVRRAVDEPFRLFAAAGFEPPGRLSQDFVEVQRGDAAGIGIQSPERRDVVPMLVFSVIPVDCDIFRDRATYEAYGDVVYWVESLLGVAEAEDPTVAREVAAGDSVVARRYVRQVAEQLATCGA